MPRRWALLVLLAACTSSPPPDEHPPMAADEKQRAVQLCQGYVDRVCACAAKESSLREACDLARAQPSAVRMHLDVLAGAPLATVDSAGRPAASSYSTPPRRPPLNDAERRLTESSLRKVVAACVELDAKLPPQTCPR